MTLYVVVADGYVFEGYGSAMYLLGVFTSKELAAKCVAENTKKEPYFKQGITVAKEVSDKIIAAIDEYDSNNKSGLHDLVPKIIEVEGDKTFPLVKTDEPYETVYKNDNYIGGYIE